MAERLRTGVLVVGAGPAGLAAACRAAEAGADTLVLDENPHPGGQIWRRGTTAVPKAGRPWLERFAASGARLEQAVSVVDVAAERTLVAERGGQRIDIGWERLILATGARELFLPFPGWTLPGVLGLGGLQAMVKGGAMVAGKRVVVAGSGPLVLPVAATLRRKGARLVTVAEQAPEGAVLRFVAALRRWPSKLAQAAALRLRFPLNRYRTGTWVARAEGDEALTGVVLTDGERSWAKRCDLLAASYGLVPNLELARLLGCEIVRHPVAGEAVVTGGDQATSVEGVWAAGEVCGIGGVEVALTEGEIAGATAAGAEIEAAALGRRARQRRFAALLAQTFEPRRELFDRVTATTTICRCEDVRWEAIDPDWTMRQSKLYRRTGMGPCQGRVCSPLLERLCGWTPDSVRPPLKPVSARTLVDS